MNNNNNNNNNNINQVDNNRARRKSLGFLGVFIIINGFINIALPYIIYIITPIHKI